MASRLITLRGCVQGCGLRPGLARLANSSGWSGSVQNTNRGVRCVFTGDLPTDDILVRLIQNSLPTAASVQEIEISEAIEEPATGFRFEDSSLTDVLVAAVPLDRSICTACLRELLDPADRRFLDPFMTCAECGPRYSIIHAMPYDRERTAMSAFQPCPECLNEYADSGNRRFHAQTISCPQCGPRLWLSSPDGSVFCKGADAWKQAAAALRQGRILAIKGVGGYQLLVDATDEAAVQRLRSRKQRPDKPFAVLCCRLEDAACQAEIGSLDAHQLRSPASPIVLCRQLESSTIARCVNPGLRDLGLMLPATALHVLLLDEFNGPLVCTSGNVDSEPLVYEVDCAEQDLAEIADLWLHHNRDIVRPIDDSVVRPIAGRAMTLRAARGLAPVSYVLPASFPAQGEVIAYGGEMKNAIGLSKNGFAILGPHIGSLETVATQVRWHEQREALLLLYQIPSDHQPVVVCDAHPRYFTTEWAQNRGERPVRVGHHHAHVLAGAFEQQWARRKVLGVAWDGAGFGDDGTTWGGEFLVVEGANVERVGHFRPFYLPGGDCAARDPRRSAVGVLAQLNIATETLASLLELPLEVTNRLGKLLSPGLSPETTSCGRLFDVAACLILQQYVVTYEGQAAAILESACVSGVEDSYPFVISDGRPAQIDWRPAFDAMIDDVQRKTSPGVMAVRFHLGLADVICRFSARFPTLPVVLQGGVFQNRVLTERIAQQWPCDGPPLGLPGSIPPNDGGLALGQIIGALVTK